MWPSAHPLWTIPREGVKPAFLAGFWLLAGCVSPGPVAMRHPDYRPAAIRRPAVVLQVSLDRRGFAEEAFTREERAAIPDQFEAGLLDALNSQGIFPLDITLTTAGTPNRGEALARARSLRADLLLLVDMHLGRRDLVYCRETARPFLARSTLLEVTLEVLRVSDGTQLLLEPPAPDQPLTDIEAECGRERSVRRLSLEELAGAGISRVLTLLLRR